jgi:uncharacterized protein YbjT (DUF2867 family)
LQPCFQSRSGPQVPDELRVLHCGRTAGRGNGFLNALAGRRFPLSRLQKSMVVLLTGATGFIGRHLLRALLAHGHEVRCALRDPARCPDPRAQALFADFVHDRDAPTWAPRVRGVDVVVNAVGILRERGNQTFAALHEQAPCALFTAAAAARVRLVVQISALGADAEATSGYHLSKKRADDCLAALPVDSVIVQPSLVFGTDGASARLFALLASLPLLPLPAGGRQCIQPLHVDDLCAAIVALIACPPPRAARLALVGPEVLSVRAYLATLRAALGVGGHARVLPVPWPLAMLGARIAAALPGALLDRETLDMLARGNTGSAADNVVLRRLLGRPPRCAAEFIGAAESAWLRTRARLDWLLPLLRFSIALVWIATGVVSLGVYPVEQSYALLARSGVPDAAAPLMLYGAALLDLAIGIGILLLRRRAWLWLLQLALIGVYTVIISLRLPEYWLHPYGPVLKNLPLLVAIWLMYEFERDNGRTPQGG